MDRWKSYPIKCEGGLRLDLDALSQGIQYPGSATILQNYEPAIEGGYKRVLGFQKFDDDEVPGSGPVLGVKVGLNGAVAARYDGVSSYDMYFGGGAGWTKVNSAARLNPVTKARGVFSAVLSPSIIMCDGANPAIKWDGATDTLINGVGAPADPKFAAVYKNRLVLAGYSADPQEISISEPNTDEGFDGASGAASIPCYDIIVGLKTFRDELFIYCENSIWKLVGSTIADFAIVNVTLGIGCVSGDTIQELGGDIIFLAQDGFRSTAATARIGDIELGLLSKAIQPLIREQLSRALAQDNYSSLLIRSKSQYRLFINQNSISPETQIGIIGKVLPRSSSYDLSEYHWATIRGIQPYCADSAYTSYDEYALLGSNTDGFVYRMEQGTSFDGASINAIYRSPDLPMEEGVTIRKVFHKAEISTQLEGDIHVDLNIYLDREADSVRQPGTIPIDQNNTFATYGTAVYGTSVYGSIDYPVFKKNLVGSGFVMSFQFISDGTDAPHRIDDFVVTYAPKQFR